MPPPAVAEPLRPAHAPSAALSRAAGKPRYMPYGDAARVLGTVAVVVQHVCDMALFDPQTPEASWWTVNVVDAFCRWAVPVYIMLSGALLLDPARQEAPSQFYRKRLARLGIPIVFWSAFYMAFSIYYTQWTTPEQAWRDLALGKPYAHLHFIFRIMGLYAFTPMLRVFLAHASRRLTVQAIAILFGLAVANTITEAFTGGELSAFFRFFPFLGFYLLGYLLRDHRLSGRSVWACILLLAASALIVAGGTGLLAQVFGLREFPSPGMMLYDFTSPFRIALGVCAWLLLVHFFDERWLNSRAGRFTSEWLAPATLGIYLVHPAFREIFHVHGIHAQAFPIIVGIPLVAVLVYVPSVLFTIAIMRIPFVRKIVV